MPCKRVSLSIWTLLGKLEGVRLPEFVREKNEDKRVPFLEPKDIKVSNLGPSGTLVKVQGFPELISDYGAQTARL
jgi:hypothetical protein